MPAVKRKMQIQYAYGKQKWCDEGSIYDRDIAYQSRDGCLQRISALRSVYTPLSIPRRTGGCSNISLLHERPSCASVLGA